MSKTQPKPILNASLPPQFRQFRLALAREPGRRYPDVLAFQASLRAAVS